jgi:DNA-binding MarR family transcriptional regulator
MENSDGIPSSHELAGDLGSVLERVVALLRSLNTAYALSRTASATLASLERNGPSRLTALATREGVTQPAMTQLISRLQDSGLVRREPDPTDGRVVLVSITDQGRRIMAERRDERAGRLAALLSEISPEHRAALATAIPALEALTGAHGLTAARPASPASPVAKTAI